MGGGITHLMGVGLGILVLLVEVEEVVTVVGMADINLTTRQIDKCLNLRK